MHLALIAPIWGSASVGYCGECGSCLPKSGMELFGELAAGATLAALAGREVLVPKEVLRELSLPQVTGVFAAPRF